MESRTLRQLNKAPLLSVQRGQFQCFRSRISVKYEVEALLPAWDRLQAEMDVL